METRGAIGFERAIHLLREVAESMGAIDDFDHDDMREAVDQVLDRLEGLGHELVADRSLLAGYAQNLADARRTIAELEAELAGTLAVAVSERRRKEELMDEVGDLEARVVDLAQYEVSAKAQLRALRRSIPQAARKRFPGHRGSGDGATSA